MDYELTRLNSRSFEQLVQALAIEIIGPKVVVFGDGPDGGREATFEGDMWPFPSETEPWAGNLVVQAKFRQHLKGTATDTRWALRELKKELEETFAPNSKRTKPTHYIFATNVALSSVAEVGGKAKAEEILRGYGLEFQLWDYDQLRAHLDVKEKARTTFAAFITPGDVLAKLIELLDKATPDFDRVIATYLQKELVTDQYTNLEQSGHVSEERTPISRVFVDLPILTDEEEDRPDLIASALELASESLSPKLQPEGNPSEQGSGPVRRGRLVLVGGPGQGKTTAGQFLCQLFRTSILRSRPPSSLSPEATAALALMESQCEEQGIPIPPVRRFPIRIDLTELSDLLADKAGPDSLLEAMTEIVSRRSGHPLSQDVFREWLSLYPWLLVLDGLDEVPASGNRDVVLDAIGDFWVDAASAESDVLVIATTRPQGYNDDFSPQFYEHLTLAPLSADRARGYGERLARARYGNDTEHQKLIVDRLDKASRGEATAKLMTSPLQVSIMAALVEWGEPPTQRWKLFSDYYDLIYRRELGREIPAVQVLREHKEDVDAIHRRVALILQVEGEHATYAEARLPKDRFAAIVRAQLLAEGHAGPALSELVEQIIAAASDRLVFLVGLKEDEVGFEIRSLQEFMAAEALMDGGDPEVADRLREIAGVTSWRNVFLFAAGHCFTQRRYLRDTINTICGELNDPALDPLAPIALPGSALAANLLADGTALKAPKHARLLTREAVGMVGRHFGTVQLLQAYDAAGEDAYRQALIGGLEAGGMAREECIFLLLLLSQDGIEWADEILDDRLLCTVEGLTEALATGRGVTGGWLPKRIEAQASELSLEAIFDHRDVLAAFAKRMPESPTIAIASIFDDPWLHSRSEGVPLAGTDVHAFELNMRWIDEPRAGGRIGELIETAEPEALAAAGTGARAAAAFAREPSAAQLAVHLEAIAEGVPPDEWSAVGTLSSWPLSTTLQHADYDPAKLRGLAGLAREGALGDLADWEAAEKRWQSVTLADIDYVPAVDAPFDSAIATRGFPVDRTAGIGRGLGMSEIVARVLQSWLQEVQSEATKGRLCRWLVLALQMQTHLNERLPAESFAEYLTHEQALKLATYRVVAGLAWSDEPTPAEAAALDALGRALTETTDGQLSGPPFSPEISLPVGLARAWHQGHRSDGLFRLLAIGAPNRNEEPLPADPEIAERNPGPAGLLALKGDWLDLDVGDAVAKMAGTWETEPIWLGEAVEVAERRSDDPGAERILLAIWDALSARARESVEARQLMFGLEDMAGELIDARASRLDQEDVWASLGFFDKPAVPAPPP